MSNLRTEQPVFETDRITDGFDIFFWVFNDASSFVATHWHTAIAVSYTHLDVYKRQTYIFLLLASCKQAGIPCLRGIRLILHRKTADLNTLFFIF